MEKAILNLEKITAFDDIEENAIYTSKRALFGASIGSQQLDIAVLAAERLWCDR